MSSLADTTGAVREWGYSGADWTKYIVYRPIYPMSFFNRIYAYHSLKPDAAWSTCHDIGAGSGIVSSALASRFSNVIVSDPNDDYITLAQKLLLTKAPIPGTRFRFLQESAEKSSVEPATVDLITACECIHWTDPDAAIQQFGKELKPGGTLVMTHYTIPHIVGNDAAQRIWMAIWRAWSDRAQGQLYDRAFAIANLGLDSVGFPDMGWEAIKRIYINADGNTNSFVINNRIGENRVKEGEEMAWVEGDEDWCDLHGIDWLKGHFDSWGSLIPQSEMQHLWDELGVALQGGKVKIKTPIVMVFATKEYPSTNESII